MPETVTVIGVLILFALFFGFSGVTMFALSLTDKRFRILSIVLFLTSIVIILFNNYYMVPKYVEERVKIVLEYKGHY